ncbi:hypothetical protein POM88_011814 [Heracleum sosnowskyi]|uniref:Uncharacterized protein n=1 Tax=Heracleum sosnowskyi TaxID=360622 RepID=A0AAD8IXH2_9APIA|nr:hypothetical protein POM88_011814 [Heracleum sosnowskyi]
MVLLSEIVQTFILADFCYYYVKIVVNGQLLVSLPPDFEVSLAYESDDFVPPGVVSPTFAQYAVSSLTDASVKYSGRNLSSPIKASLHFSLCRSGIFSLDRVDAVIEVSEWVKIPKKKLTVENSTSEFPNITVEGSPQNVSEETADNLNSEGGLNITDSSVDNQNSTDLIVFQHVLGANSEMNLLYLCKDKFEQ